MTDEGRTRDDTRLDPLEENRPKNNTLIKHSGNTLKRISHSPECDVSMYGGSDAEPSVFAAQPDVETFTTSRSTHSHSRSL